MNVYFISFGCKVNQYESAALKSDFSENGFNIVSDMNDADVFIVNSCTVTSNSDKKMRQTMRKLRREHPQSIIVLTGCFPQAFRKEAEAIPEADIVTGTSNRSSIVPLVKQRLENKERILLVEPHSVTSSEPHGCREFTDKTRAFVKIQDGCNQFCSYCIIPFSRGRVRSKPLDVLVNEITQLAASGHKEVVLVGINLAFYGADSGLRLVDAVEACSKIEGIVRIRLGSLEPEMISEDDLVRLSKIEKLCPQFHLSLQSGCDRTLNAMNRRYTSAEYRALTERIKALFPECSLTTDVMTGFPGETEEDFAQSLEFVKSIGFEKVHVFPYSRRSGTAADKMPEQLSETIKYERAGRMSEASLEMQEKFMHKQLGKIVPVLFEKENCTEFHYGYSPNYTLVKIKRHDPKKSLRKSILYVKIISCEKDYCLGEIVPG